MAISASQQDEERFLASEIAKAVYFTAHIRLSPFDKITERHETAEEAFAAADRLVALSKFGRRSIVYAVTPRGDTIPCTRALYEASKTAQDYRI